MSIKRHHLILIAILILSAALRFTRLGEHPPGLYHDEAYNGLDALALLDGDTFPNFYEGWELYAQDAHANRPAIETRWPIFFEGNFGREPLHIYLMAASIALSEPSPAAIRAVPALAGVLATFTTYLSAQALLDTSDPKSKIQNPKSKKKRRKHRTPIPNPQSPLPLFAAFFIAILYPAVTFSRFGVRAMLFLPLATLSITYFWKAVRQRPTASRQWLIAGFFLGLALYTYAAARLLPLVFIIFIPIWLWRTQQWRTYWKPVAYLAGASILTAAPLLIFFIRYPYFFIFRTAYVANKGLGTVPDQPWLTWLNNIGRVASGLVYQGEMNIRHNLPGRAYLDPIQTIMLILGFVGTLTQRHLRHLFLYIWLAVMLLPSILSGDAPHFGRLIGAAPPLAILMAIGVNWAIETSRQPRLTVNFTRRLHYGTVAGLATLLILSTLKTTSDYFVKYAQHPDLSEAFYVNDWLVGQFSAEQTPNTKLYLTPSQEHLATIYFALGGDTERFTNYNGSEGIVPAGQINTPSLYFIRQNDETSLQRLTSYFLAGSLQGDTLGTIHFRVPADAPRVPSFNPTDLALGDGIGLIDWNATQFGDELFVTLYWQASATPSTKYTVFIHLLDAEGNLVGQVDRPPAGYPTDVWQTGEVIADQFMINISQLPDGRYTLQTGLYDTLSLDPLSPPAPLGATEIRTLE